MANWEMTVSTTDTTVLSGGTSWVGLQTLVTRSDSQPFVPGTAYWYSPCVTSSVYTTNTHFCLYLKGNLVTASGGIPPSCRPLPTCTPISGGAMAMFKGLLLEGGNTPTETPTPSYAGASEGRPTPTFSPTALPSGLVQSLVAAPNLSNNGQPIKFFVNLNQPAKVTLGIFTLAGEKIYDTQMEGNAGLNTITWQLQNRVQEVVASGLYLYLLQVNRETRVGKLVILH
jgi:hypothetical protein